jgi:hypothetical protein
MEKIAESVTSWIVVQDEYSFFQWYYIPGWDLTSSFFEASRLHSFRHTTLGKTPLDE